jgi:hypothetical protein
MPPAQKSAARKTSTARKKAPARKASAARKSSAERSASPRATAAKRALCEENSRAVVRIKKALETTQREMTAVRGSLEAGGRDLRKDVTKLLRDARRDVEKMNTTVRRDLQRLQKDLTSTSKARASQAARKTPRKAAPNAGRGRRRAS